jgi:hypothetical protein
VITDLASDVTGASMIIVSRLGAFRWQRRLKAARDPSTPPGSIEN